MHGMFLWMRCDIAWQNAIRTPTHLDLSHLLSRSPAYGVVGAPVLDFLRVPRETLERAAEKTF